MKTPDQNLATIRKWLIVFILLLVLSGITAFPIESELQWLSLHLSSFPETLQIWICKIYDSVKSTNEKYPQLAYGTDWLAFAHIVIATAFIGPYIDPVKNKWVIQFGIIACVMVFPLAFIAGNIRQIPFYWQLIDCSFGLIGIIPLYIIHKLIKRIE